MSSAEEIEDWSDAAAFYCSGQLESALHLFVSLKPSARLRFNVACCYQMLNHIENAEIEYLGVIALDKYFVLPYLKLAEIYYYRSSYDKALEYLELTNKMLRGNRFVDYRPLGMNYLLYACQVVANEGLVLACLKRMAECKKRLSKAVKLCLQPQHEDIKSWFDNIQANKSCRFFTVPGSLIFTPSQSMILNAEKRDFLGKSKILTEDVEPMKKVSACSDGEWVHVDLRNSPSPACSPAIPRRSAVRKSGGPQGSPRSSPRFCEVNEYAVPETPLVMYQPIIENDRANNSVYDEIIRQPNKRLSQQYEYFALNSQEVVEIKNAMLSHPGPCNNDRDIQSQAQRTSKQYEYFAEHLQEVNEIKKAMPPFPGAVNPEACETKGSPDLTKKSPALPKNSPVPTKKLPTLIKNSPTPTKKLPVHTKRENDDALQHKKSSILNPVKHNFEQQNKKTSFEQHKNASPKKPVEAGSQDRKTPFKNALKNNKPINTTIDIQQDTTILNNRLPIKPNVPRNKPKSPLLNKHSPAKGAVNSPCFPSSKIKFNQDQLNKTFNNVNKATVAKSPLNSPSPVRLKVQEKLTNNVKADNDLNKNSERISNFAEKLIMFNNNSEPEKSTDENTLNFVSKLKMFENTNNSSPKFEKRRGKVKG